jgi:hypothetical protein
MKRTLKSTLAVLAILTFVVPAVANAQSLNFRTGNNPAIGQIVQRVIAGLTRQPYQNQYAPQQIRRRGNSPAFSAYQNGYAQGAADARNAARYNQYNQYGVNNGYQNGYQNQYPQNFGNRYNGYQPNVRGSWRGGY